MNETENIIIKYPNQKKKNNKKDTKRMKNEVINKD